jgi:hypothetical protein
LVLASLASGIALVRTRGYLAPAGLLTFSDAEYTIVRAVADRLCAVDEPSAPTAQETRVAEFVDAQCSALDAPLRRDLGRFLLCIEHLAPLAAGHRARFSSLPASLQDAVLSKLEASPSEVFRGGFQGLKALIFMGYYRDDRSFAILGYEGPQVKLP